MSLFDKSQEVLDIVLTSYGKQKLAEAKTYSDSSEYISNFAPVYYSFHDDEVIYDTNYANSSESLHTSSLSRILDNSLYLKLQNSPKQDIKTVDHRSVIKRDTFDINRYNNIVNKITGSVISGLPLGQSSLAYNNYPAWSLSMQKGIIDSAFSSYNIAINGYKVNIPQINLSDLESRYSRINNYFDEKNRSLSVELVTYPDNSALKYEIGDILISLEEKNVDNLNKNFEIEIFEVDEENNNLKQVNFRRPPENIVENILLDTPIAYNVDSNVLLVDNLFLLFVDKEIDFNKLPSLPQPIEDKVGGGPFGVDC